MLKNGDLALVRKVNIVFCGGGTGGHYYPLMAIKQELDKKLKNNTSLIIAGDFNIIPEEKDAYAPEKYINDALFKLEVRKRFRNLINLGLQDVFRNYNKKEGNYTFWDYQKGSWQKNNGLRLDHVLVSNNLIDLIKKIEIKKTIRNQIKPSDHVPVECVIN